MSFAGKVWRLLVGIKDALVLILLLAFFSGVFALLSVRPSPGMVNEGALLLDLDGVLVEEVAPIDPLNLVLGGTLPIREYATRDLVAAIDGAAEDDRIKAIALDLTTFLGGGQAHLAEITAALDRFRAAEKPVFAYAVAYTDDSLMLAAHASEVWVDPLGGAAVRGPGGQQLYIAGLLERFGINAHVFRVGTYKSAVEPYLLSGMSPEARENSEAIYSSLWEEWRANVKTARPEADIEAVSRQLPELLTEHGGDLAGATLAAGVADRAGTRVEWGERIAEEVGGAEWDDTPGAFAMTEYDPWLAAIAPAGQRNLTGSGTGKPIGIVTVAGEIIDGEAGPGTAGADRIARLLDDALDDDLAALVVRIDSPGGTVTGSETIRRAIMRHKANDTPIVVSMGNYAASGGYWVATPADRIFAAPETLTGSIGVFAVLPTFEELLAEYGVNSDGVRTTQLSGQPDLLGGLTPEIAAVLQASVESNYTQFLSLVAESRGISAARADELGQGRVFTGGTARQLGLVDQFGDLDAAIEWAASNAQLGDGEWHARYLSEPPATIPALLSGMLTSQTKAASPGGADMVSLFARRERDMATRSLADLVQMLRAPGVQARCLECIAARPTRASAPPAGPLLPRLAALLLGS